MKNIVSRLQRSLYALTAVLLGAVTFVPITVNAAAAGGQVQTRYIKMSSSSPGATGVSYDVEFNPASSYTLKGVIVDFCAGTSTPLVGLTCTAPTGFSVGAVPTITNNPDGNATVNVAAWTPAMLNTNRTVSLTNSTGVAVTSASIVNFSIDTVTNPTTPTGTFYARVLTYTTNAPTYTAGSEGTYQDFGGFALSTASAIGITARVMEQLSFCVYNATCGDSTAIELGSGTPAAISTALSTVPLKFSLSTNAVNGAVVRLNGDTLKSGGNTIAAVGQTNAAIGVGSGKFGVRLPSVTATTGTMTVAATYNSATNFGLNLTNTNSAYGDTFASSTGALDSAVGTFTYGVAAATTTAAGIYTTTHQLVATGTF